MFGMKGKTSDEINVKAGYVEFFKDKIKFEQNGQIQIMAIKKFLNDNKIEMNNSGKIFFETLAKNELLVLELNNVKAYFYFNENDKQNFLNFYKNEFSKPISKLPNNCGCETFKMDDIKITQCQPYPIILEEKYQIAISVTYIENVKYIMLTIRFLNSESNVINSDLMIFTTGNNILNLQLLDTTKDYIGGSEICHAKFELTNKNFELLKLEKITDIRFTIENDDLHKTHKIKDNNDVLYNQLNCLK